MEYNPEFVSNRFLSYSSEQDKNLTFHVSKVYSIIFYSLIMFALGITIGLYLMSTALVLFAIIGVFGFLIAIVVLSEQNRDFYMSLLSVCFGYSAWPLIYSAQSQNGMIVPLASLITIIIFGTFTFLSKYIKDENMLIMNGFLCSVLISHIFIGIVFIFFPVSNMIHLIYLSFGILTFCGYISYDTKLMYDRFRLGHYDHYYHALNLFLDIINIFLTVVEVLMIVMGNKNTKTKKETNFRKI